ncbi:MarR family winged helix-turn-helix transcriptional regulator [Luteimicrobium subarcticum]|uniref:DNA-binding MarR family transcriptional regulator n=1 Tax=Luteimicrobium subarcticum TaxID=620910 RepID=A0A2M8WTG4_9MICO|nr:MarR family winged helix-turn-helix transcriptional regulator [Luteimicrobium subarcticum]PJI94178.1 DNA-binding MarR family transcriptional regulator [Luteimicrobium subarcticum]
MSRGEDRDDEAPTAVAAWESLFRAQVAVLRRLGRDPIWGEVSFREYDVLYTLRIRPGCCARLRELAASSLLTQPSLSRMVERLEERSLVERRPVPDDARGTLVVLTDAGMRLVTTVGRRHAEAIDAYVGEALEPSERAALRTLTEKLRAAQGQIPDLARG